MKQTISLKNIQIKDYFWSHYQTLVREEVIPYQWKTLNDQVPDAEPSHAIKNFKIAAGLETGEFHGFVFQDSDVAKWLEAVGYSLSTHKNPELEKCADLAIELIEKAQQPDGYINTFFTIKAPEKRWTNLLDCHELYCAGHMIEAAIAYYEGTGKRQLLDVVCRFADLIEATFGKEDGKIHGYCGHQEVELALVKLSEVTNEQKYLNLAKYFIDERGQAPKYFIDEFEKRGRISHWTQAVSDMPDFHYTQSHVPVREQNDAVGHAVRAVYMYTGMADIARHTGDESLIAACKRLWNSIEYKQLYITGGIGSTNHGEAFTFDYDLPNDLVYQETCASIGLIFFAKKMLNLEPNRKYADVMERSLYNSVLSGMALDGKSFFYVNPLEVWPEACEKNPTKHHVKAVRQKWFGCACCPPNIARLVSSLGNYIYTVNEDTIYTHLYMSHDAEINLQNQKVKLSQVTNYPWSGEVALKIGERSEGQAGVFTIAVRIPSWCTNATVTVNGESILAEAAQLENGYLKIARDWQNGDEILLNLDMPATFIQAHPNVRADAGKVAIYRGPLVYCLEEVDNGNNLSALSVDTTAPLEILEAGELLSGMQVICGKGTRDIESDWEGTLYKPYVEKKQAITFKAVPYALWGNRKAGEMSVWLRKS